MIALTACQRLDQGSEMNPATTSQFEMQRVCVGRFFVDLPVHFEFQAVSDAELFYGLGPDHTKVKVESVRRSSSPGGVRSVVDERLSELRALHHFRSPTKTFLAAHREIEPGLEVIRSFEGARTVDAIRIELFKAAGSSVAKFTELAFGDNTPDKVETRLTKLAQGTGSHGPQSPTQRILCLDGLAIGGAQDGEIVAVTYRSKQWPDVVFEAVTNSVIQEFDGGLLRRWNAKSADLRAAGFSLRTIRSGPVSLAGAKAEELLTDGKEAGKLRRDFDAETLPRPSSMAEPMIKISLRAGGQVGTEYVDPGLSEPEALALWAAITRSVRATSRAGS